MNETISLVSILNNNYANESLKPAFKLPMRKRPKILYFVNLLRGNAPLRKLLFINFMPILKSS